MTKPKIWKAKAMPCSTDFARSQIKAMAMAKTVAVAKLRITPQQQADMIDFMAGQASKRFDGEVIARACEKLCLEQRGWPEPSEFLDACAKCHNEQAERIENHRRRSQGGETLADSLHAAGLPVTALRGVQMSRWVGLFEIHHDISAANLRAIVEAVKAGDKLIVGNGRWRLSDHSQITQDGAVKITQDIHELEAHGTIGGKPALPVLAKLGRAMLERAGYDPETAARAVV